MALDDPTGLLDRSSRAVPLARVDGVVSVFGEPLSAIGVLVNGNAGLRGTVFEFRPDLRRRVDEGVEGARGLVARLLVYSRNGGIGVDQ